MTAPLPPSDAPEISAADLGPDVPRRGMAWSEALGRAWLKAMGWRVTGYAPQLAKAVFIGAPHTSNRDGLVAAATLLTLRIRMNVMAKAELFKGPFGPLFRWLGVLPVYRTDSRGGQVEQIAAQFAEHERLYVGIAPEGTRHASKAWKSGFYHVAVAAGVPIVPFILDFGRRELRILSPFIPTHDISADMQHLIELYRGIIPADPSRLSKPLRELQ